MWETEQEEGKQVTLPAGLCLHMETRRAHTHSELYMPDTHHIELYMQIGPHACTARRAQPGVPSPRHTHTNNPWILDKACIHQAVVSTDSVCSLGLGLTPWSLPHIMPK